jgi:uncharacterized phage infection (PIP) family protein YhgE
MRRAALVIGAAALLALAGCGGGGGGESLSEEDYGTAVQETGNVLEEAFAEIAEEAQAVSGDVGSLDEAGEALEALAATVAKGADALETAANDLETLEPPDEAADANQQLVDGLRALAADFDELEAALEGGDFSEIIALGEELQQIASSDAGKQIESAIEELESQGYDVQGDDG